ncbi:MAG TPA: phage tail protein [Anaerolineae bacterium]
MTGFSAPTQQQLSQQRADRAMYQMSEEAISGGSNSAKPPAQAFRFYIERSGIVAAEFTECSGLDMTRAVKDYEEGGTNDFVYKLPGRTSYSNITLRRGITYTRELWDWFVVGLYDGKVKRQNFSIILGNGELKKVKQWDVFEAFPVKWSGADLSTETLQVALESIEIAHHGINLSAEETHAL